MNSNIATQDESLATNAKLHREGILTHAIQSQSSSSEPSESCTDGISFVSEVEIPLAEGEDAERERSASQRLEKVLQLLPVGVVMLDSRGQVSDCNPAAAELLGGQLKGASWREIINDKFHPRLDYVQLGLTGYTHLNHILQNHAHEILGHEEVQQLLTLLAQHSPKLAEELPEIVNTNIVLKVLQNLLSEQVPIRDMRTIAETLAAHGGKSQDSVALTAAVRMALNRVIAQSIYGDRAELPVITLDTDLEQILLKSLQQSALSGAEQEDNMTIEPKLAESLQRSLVDTAQKQEVAGDPAVLLVAAPLRPMLSRFARYTIEGLKVLSYQEIPDNKQVTIVASVGG